MLDKLLVKLFSKRLITSVVGIVAAELVVFASKIGVTLSEQEIMTALLSLAGIVIAYIAAETKRPSVKK